MVFYNLFHDLDMLRKKLKRIDKKCVGLGLSESRSRVEIQTSWSQQLDMMAQRLARRAEDREVPGSSPTRD